MVEWSKDLYTNPHIVKKLQNNIIHNNSETELQSLVQDISIDDPLEYEKVKQHKHVLEDGIRLFNQKPKKGMKYFMDRGLVQDSIESQAAFLHAENQRLQQELSLLAARVAELENNNTAIAVHNVAVHGKISEL